MGKELSDEVFLRRLKKQFKISHIFYPGAGTDKVLEGPFTLKEIFYLDKYKPIPATRFERKGHYILARYSHSPIRHGVFDALFYEDNHSNLEETVEMIRTVRPGGLVIHSSPICEELDALAMERLPGISRVRLPYSNEHYTIFQKS